MYAIGLCPSVFFVSIQRTGFCFLNSQEYDFEK